MIDDLFMGHDTGQHPESPARIRAVKQAVLDRPELEKISFSPASQTVVRLVHQQEYLTQLKQICRAGGGWLDADTVVKSDSYQVAMAAVGACLAGMQCLLEGDLTRVFAAIRPPGHHAHPGHGAGFCLLNNAAVAIRYAQQQTDAKVLLVDFDAHHGDGSQAIFYTDDTVFYFSTHQYPGYPGSGTKDEIGQAAGRGYTANWPVPPGSGDGEILPIYQDKLPQIVDWFQPDLVVVSAGYDLHQADPLTQLQMSTAGIGQIVSLICQLNLPVMFVLEGGYNLAALQESVAVSLSALTS